MITPRFALLASCCALLAALLSLTPGQASPTPSPRRNIVDRCNSPGGRCIYAPNIISVRSQDIVESGQIDANNYVALLSSGAASGFAFGNCNNSPKTDNVNWAFTSTTGGGKQLATCSGNKDNNVLIEAFFGDNSTKVMTGKGTVVSDTPSVDLTLRCKGGRIEADAAATIEAKSKSDATTTDLAPRAKLADRCGQPLVRCIFAPTFIHLATDDVLEHEAIDADSYVALLISGAARGSAFGKCDGHTQDAVDWTYSAAKVPAGQRPLALVSGNDHNNTLIRAYFSDNPGKVMSGGGSVLDNSDSPDLKITCGGRMEDAKRDENAKAKGDSPAAIPTTGLARRASLADSCNQPDARCIFAPKFVSIQSKDIVQEEEVDGNTYVVLLAKHAAKGTAFGICSTAQGSDTIDWQFTQAQVPAGQKPIAVVSGNDHNNVLLKAYFSDRPNQVMVGKGSVVTNAPGVDLTIEC